MDPVRQFWRTTSIQLHREIAKMYKKWRKEGRKRRVEVSHKMAARFSGSCPPNEPSKPSFNSKMQTG